MIPTQVTRQITINWKGKQQRGSHVGRRVCHSVSYRKLQKLFAGSVGMLMFSVLYMPQLNTHAELYVNDFKHLLM